MNRIFPFGKPSQEPGAYSGDIQTREDDAYRLYHWCQNKLTPTGRLQRRVNKETFARNLNEALSKLRKLAADYPPIAERVGYAIADAEDMLQLISKK
jgi:hypothetical protein